MTIEPIDIGARVDDEHRAGLEAIPPELLDLTDLPAARSTIEAAAALKPLPEGVSTEDRTVAAGDGAAVTVRLYRRADKPHEPAALYWIHGGGMVMGSVAMNDALCGSLALELGILVASVEYRLAPEHPYPTPMEDCYSGLRWLFGTAGSLDVDPARIAIGGASAGGGLAAGVALAARDRGEVAPVLQLLVYPMLDDRNVTASSHRITDPRVWNRATNIMAWNAYLGGRAGSDDVDPYAAPARAIDWVGLPPAYLAVGELDLFLDETIAYAQSLMAAGVGTELHVYAGAFHGSNSFVPESDPSIRWRRGELDALSRALLRPASRASAAP